MDELRRVLEDRSERGSPRGIDELVATAQRRADLGPTLARDRTSPRRRVLVAVAASIVVLAGGLVWLTSRSTPDRGNVATTPTTTVVPPALRADWTATAPAGIAGRFAAATATDGRRMFVFGGLSGSRTTSLVDGGLFEPASNTWEHVPDAPQGFGGPDAVAVWDGHRFLVLAPADTDAPVRLAAYDPDAHAWHELAPPPLGARDGLVAVWTGTRLIVGGGGAGDGIPLPFGASYDPDTDAWMVLPQPPFPHYVPAAAVWNGSAVVFVGGIASDEGTSASVQRRVPGAMYTPGSPGEWASTVPPGPVSQPQWATMTSSGIAVLGTSDGPRVESASFDWLNNGWVGFRTIDTPGAAVRAVPVGQNGWSVITESGGIVVTPDRVRSLPATDLSDHVVPSIITVGDALVIWGGLTKDQTGAVNTGLFIRLDEIVATPTTTTSPEAPRQPPLEEISLDLDGDGRSDDLRATSAGERSTLQLTLATGQTSQLPFTTCGSRLVGVGRLGGRPLIFYNECGATIVNAQLATIVQGDLTPVTIDDAQGSTDEVGYHAHSNCCPLATVDVTCTTIDGGDALLRTGSRLVHNDGSEVTDASELGVTKSSAELSSQFKRAWTRSIYRLNAQRLELVRTDSGTIALDAPDPDGVPLRNRLDCGDAMGPHD